MNLGLEKDLGKDVHCTCGEKTANIKCARGALRPVDGVRDKGYTVGEGYESHRYDENGVTFCPSGLRTSYV